MLAGDRSSPPLNTLFFPPLVLLSRLGLQPFSPTPRAGGSALCRALGRPRGCRGSCPCPALPLLFQLPGTNLGEKEAWWQRRRRTQALLQLLPKRHDAALCLERSHGAHHGHPACELGACLARRCLNQVLARQEDLGGLDAGGTGSCWPGTPSFSQRTAQGPLSAREPGGSRQLVAVGLLNKGGRITRAYYGRVPRRGMPAHAGLLLSVQESWTRCAGLLL